MAKESLSKVASSLRRRKGAEEYEKNSHSLLHRLSIFRGCEGVRSMSIFDIAADSSSHPVRFLSDFFHSFLRLPGRDLRPASMRVII